MGIVLSHTTARAVYQTVHSIARSGVEPCSDATILKSHPSRKLVDDALRWLAIHNVEADENAPIETMVFERNGMRNLTGCRTHVSTKRFSSSRFVKLTDDISIVGVELCALQAATYLPFRKLIEYYFELCGAYSLKAGSTTSYSERPALTTAARLKHFFNTLSACDGLIPARKAIKCVRDGCRSPMETAFVMMLTLPKNEGGLGIKALETDYEIKVANVAKGLTRRTKFYMDAYLKRSRIDIEYNGFHHDTEKNRAIDEERKNALAAMGYGIITISRHSFMHAEPFARVMEVIQRKEGLRPSRLPKNFKAKQEELRKFVLRRHLEEKKLIEEKIRRDREERNRIDYEKALLDGVLDDPSINAVPEIDDMQTFEHQAPREDNASGPVPDGKVFGVGIELK